MSHEIKKLIAGNAEFRKKFFGTDKTLFNELVHQGQRPKILVVACSDSRVDPAMIFNCQPGELFVIRNVANLVPPCQDNTTYHGTSAALEFGVRFLEVEHIIVLGHTQCGGIQALVKHSSAREHKKDESFITNWVTIAQPAYEKVAEIYPHALEQEKVTLCEQYAPINSLKNLQTFPWIAQRIQKGTLSLHAWYFELATGYIHRYDQEKKEWTTAVTQ